MTESLHALSGAYVVDALDDHERELFESHLPGCLDCQAEVATMREAAAMLADESVLTPPPGLRDAVLGGIRNIRPLPPETGHSPADQPPAQIPARIPAQPEVASNVVPMRRKRFRMATMAAAAAAVAAIGVGVTWQPWDEPTTSTFTATDRVLTADDARRVSVKFTDGSSATVVRSLSEKRAVLLTRNMAAPPEGKSFELWYQDETGRMKPAGLMTTKGDHKVLLKGDATRATGVGITVEPKEGSPVPTTEPIAVLDLEKAEA